MTGPNIREAAEMLRSRNSGAFMVTIDLILKDRAMYEHCRDTGFFTGELIGERFGVEPDQIMISTLEPIGAFKFTVPRQNSAGHLLDHDLDGAQQFVRLLDLTLPAISGPSAD